MKRRNFVKLLGMGATGAALHSVMPPVVAQSLLPTKWRSYRLTYEVNLPISGKVARLWLPLPDTNDSDYQFTQGSNWLGNADTAQFGVIPGANFPLFSASWRSGGERTVKVSSIIKTTDRTIDLQRYRAPASSALPGDVKRYLQSTKQIPLDGIVKKTALDIIAKADAKNPLQKAKAIYDWVIRHVTYDNKARGQGARDIGSMLTSENFDGKCVDIHALFVGLARASGIPARQQFGIRVNDSVLNQHLGKSGDVTSAQHCRAEFYLAGFGWVPVDPADVAQVMALDILPHDHELIKQLKDRLFGSWEMNWVAFNQMEGMDLGKLSAAPSAAGKLPFFFHPHAEIDGKPQDSFEPQTFSYKITSALLVGTGAKL
ncbi:MAG: transglutaminase-like domain-containing protein [Nitrosomonas sp.]|nr:transglutaminase-like domain-containing protein [Nitrosomonas sp.]